jgi:RNA polymerase sigma factor (sigma-70 family)
MSEKTIKITLSDGSIIEVEVSFEIWKFYKDDFWQNNWQNRKLQKELSLEELGQVVGGKNVYDLGLISDSAESEYFCKFLNEILQKAMNKLSEKQRRRIILHFFKDLTFEEIAKIENCSESSVKTMIYYALRILKENLR